MMQHCVRFVVVLVLSSVVASTGLARQAADSVLPLRRIFFKPYISGTRPTGQSISPDGNTILFQWDSSAQNKYRYWMMKIDGSDLHMLRDTLLGEIEWSPNGSKIACTRKGDVFLTDTSFTTFERLTKTEDGKSGLRFSPDGNFLAFKSDNRIVALTIGRTGLFELARSPRKDVSVNLIDFTPDSKKMIFSEFSREGLSEFVVPRYTGKDVSTNSFKSGIGKTRIGIAPVDTGSTVWVTFPGDEKFYLGDVAIAPDGKHVVIERWSTDRKTRELFISDTDSGKVKRIYDEHDDAWVEGGLATTRWMPDGKQIITTSEKDGWNHLYVMDPDGKNVKQLTNGEWELHWFDIDPHGSTPTILFLANKDDHHQWQLYSLDVQSKIVSRLSRQEGTYENPVLSKRGNFILCGHSDFRRPTDLVRVPTIIPFPGLPNPSYGDALLQTPPPEVDLTNTIPQEFNSIQWAFPEIVHFKAKDGTTVPAMIYKPHDFDSTKKYPVVVFVHGAGYLQNVAREWSYYSREYMFHHRLTQRGYLVYEVDYRGSAGYGRKFRTDVYMHLGGKDLQDELDGIEYLKHFGYIDSSRIGIYGGSYGGFMALMGLFCSDTYACGAALRAVTSWENYYRHNPYYTEPRLGKPEEHPEAYKISSPLTFADSLKNPLLILHGMLDDNVFFQDAVQLISKLQKSGKKFETMMYPEESHSFNEPESWYDEYSRIEEFFDKHLMENKH